MDEFDQAFASFDGETTTTAPEETSAGSTDTGNTVDTGANEDTNNPSNAQDKVIAETPNDGANQEPNDSTKSGDEKVKVDVHQQNHINAQRRIRQREGLVRKKDDEIRKLKERLARYESKAYPTELDSMRVDSLKEQIEDAEDEFKEQAEAYEQERLDAFNYQVAQEVGERYAEVAPILIQRWASYVNDNEPELLKLSQRPLGKHLLFEWCSRVEGNPKALQAWNLMSNYEKSEKLTQLYRAVVADHQPKTQANDNPANNAPNNPPPKQTITPNVGVAASGRGNTISQPPAEDDFGSALERKMQQLGIKKF